MTLHDILRPGLRVVIAGTIAAWHRAEREHYYAGPGNQFWTLLHASGLVPELLTPADDARLPEYGVGLTDLVRVSPRGEDVEWDLRAFQQRIRRARPEVVAFVSKTAATSYAQAAGERLPRDYGPVPWDVARRPAFVLPGPSGANNGMHLPVRIALWTDLADFLELRLHPTEPVQ